MMGAPVPTRRARRGRAPMADINVTPLVDVMLVLLIIFMVTAPLLNAAVPVDLPDSDAAPLDQAPAAVDLAMTADGRVWLGESAIDPGVLPARLAAIPRGPDGRPPAVTLRADRTLDYGRVVAVLGVLNRAGFTAVSLVTTGSGAAP